MFVPLALWGQTRAVAGPPPPGIGRGASGGSLWLSLHRTERV